MNDFTKEELEILMDYEEQGNGLSDLWRKLQSMIDNYCEHDETISDNCMVDICKQCGEYL